MKNVLTREAAHILLQFEWQVTPERVSCSLTYGRYEP